MFLVGIISWWYGEGWLGQFGRVRTRLTSTAQFFSVGQLFLTLFAPFRQISAGSVRGPVGAQLRAFFDRLLSRIIGSIVRTFTIVAGLVVMLVQLLAECVVIILWLVLPIVPVAGFIMMAIGWVPTWM